MNEEEDREMKKEKNKKSKRKGLTTHARTDTDKLCIDNNYGCSWERHCPFQIAAQTAADWAAALGSCTCTDVEKLRARRQFRGEMEKKCPLQERMAIVFNWNRCV